MYIEYNNIFVQQERAPGLIGLILKTGTVYGKNKIGASESISQLFIDACDPRHRSSFIQMSRFRDIIL